MDYVILVSAAGSAVGGLAAAASVLVALRTITKTDQEKLIDAMKAEAVSLKITFSDCDRSIAFPLFLDIVEEFKESLRRNFFSSPDREKLVDFLKTDGARVNLSRSLMSAISRSPEHSSVQRRISEMNQSAVAIGQTLPVSGHMIRMTVKLVDNVLSALINPGLYADNIDESQYEKLIEEYGKEAPTFELFLDNVASVISDSAGTSLTNRGQAVINESRVIIDEITAMIASMSYSDIKKLEATERAREKDVVYVSDKITIDLDAGLLVLKPFFDTSAWDLILAAKTRIDTVFAAQAKNS